MSHPQPALTHEKRENSTILASKPSRPAFPSPPFPMIQTWSHYRKFPFIFSNQYSLRKRNISDPLSLSVRSCCKPSLPARAGPSKIPFVGSFVPFATQQKHKSQAPLGRRGTNTPPAPWDFIALEIAVPLPGAALIRGRCGGGESLRAGWTLPAPGEHSLQGTGVLGTQGLLTNPP